MTFRWGSDLSHMSSKAPSKDFVWIDFCKYVLQSRKNACRATPRHMGWKSMQCLGRKSSIRSLVYPMNVIMKREDLPPRFLLRTDIVSEFFHHFNRYLFCRWKRVTNNPVSRNTRCFRHFDPSTSFPAMGWISDILNFSVQQWFDCFIQMRFCAAGHP